MKYWISQLSNEAIEIIKNKVYSNLFQNGYAENQIQQYIEEIENEKLGSLDYHLSYEEMKQLSNMN